MGYRYITDDIETVVIKMNYYIKKMQDKKQNVPCSEVYFLCGTASEINVQLLDKSADSTHKYRKYPLVMLRTPSPDSILTGMVDDSLNIAIVNQATKPGLKTHERMELVFKPILFPLYDLFARAIRNVGIFTWEGERDSLPGQRIIIPCYGNSLEGSAQNKFSDPLDAIELVDLKLNQTINNCII